MTWTASPHYGARQSSLDSESSENGQAIDQAAARRADAGLSPGELAYVQGSIAALSGVNTGPTDDDLFRGQSWTRVWVDEAGAHAERIEPGDTLAKPPPRAIDRQAWEAATHGRRHDDGQAQCVDGVSVLPSDAWLDEWRACELARLSTQRPPDGPTAPGPTTAAGTPRGGCGLARHPPAHDGSIAHAHRLVS